MRSTHHSGQVILKCAWVLAYLGILSIGFGTCLIESTCAYSESSFLPWLILLSFPGGLLVFVFAAFMDGAGQIDSLLLSLGIFIVGYVQWFHIVPSLLGKNQITTLSLATTKEVAAPKKSLARGSPIFQQPVPVQPARIVAFDCNGRTPLERVLNDD